MKKILIHLLIIIPFISLGQNSINQLGNLPVQNFKPTQYFGQAQVNDVVIDRKGILYIAQNSGVSVYDGAKWNVLDFKAKDEVQVNTLLISKSSKLFIGGESNFGYFKADDYGRLSFVSLLNKLPQTNKFETVYDIVETKEGEIYFLTDNSLLKFYNDELTIQTSETGYSGIFNVDNVLYLSENEKGLFYLKNDKFIPVKGIENTIDKFFYDIISFGKDSLLLTEKGNVYISPKNRINLTKIDIGGESVSTKKALKLNINDYVVCVVPNGTIRLNRKMEVVETIDMSYGLSSDLHTNYCLTPDGHLAISTENGISLVYVNSRLRKIDENNNFIGNVERIKGLGSQIAILAKEGVHIFNESNYQFTKIDAKGIPTFDGGYVESINGKELFLSMEDGLYKVLDNTVDRIDDSYAFEVYQYPLNKDYFFVGLFDGFRLFKFENNNWKEFHSYIELGVQIKNITTDKNGVVWFGTSDGVAKLNPNFNPRFDKEKGDIIVFNSSNSGLPDGSVYVQNYNNQIIFGTSKGIFDYGESSQSFKKTNQCGDYLNESEKQIHTLNVDKQNQLWAELITNINNREIGYLTNDKVWVTDEFSLLSSGIVYSFYSDSKSRTWIGGTDGLYVYDYNEVETNQFQIKTLLTKIYQNDSVYFHKYFSRLSQESTVFQFSKSALSFEFGSTNFKDAKNNSFSYYLEGFDADNKWSDWSKRYKVDYTNLSEGHYKLHVKTKNSAAVEGVEVIYEFSILPPWYRTWWFRMLMIIGVGLILFLFFKLRIKALKQRQVELENTVDERTAEVVEQKHEAEKQRDLVEEEHKKTVAQKQIIEEKNKEITDSINYAKRIQEAILPPPRLVKEWLTDSFLFYRPKDIVAGDFYWMETLKTEIEGKEKTLIYFAAADCTGHGVPGALVSVVCANALNRAVKEFKLSSPGEVLDKVSELVTASFEMGDEAIKDGMDIALCALDISTKKIYYSGANNPLYIIKPLKDKDSEYKYINDSRTHELIEYKGTKQAVGYNDTIKKFETIEIQLEPGDSMYVFSDGFADQFGGERGKKYKYASFKKFLLEHCDISMEEQKQKLAIEFDEWKRDLEQLDDVCIIGVRINGKERNNYTKRELEVLEYIRDGLSSKLIADKMNIAKTTVDTYRKRLLAKSGTFNAQELINYAIKKEII